MKKFLPLLFLTTGLSACEYFCSENFINPVFIGYSKSDMDTLVIRRFKPNDQYLTLLDTQLITDPSLDTLFYHRFSYSTSGDTTIVFCDYDTIMPIRYGYDWEIYIPARNQIVLLYNIEQGSVPAHKGCMEPVGSFMLNSQEIKSPVLYDNMTNTGGYRAFIRP